MCVCVAGNVGVPKRHRSPNTPVTRGYWGGGNPHSLSCVSVVIVVVVVLVVMVSCTCFVCGGGVCVCVFVVFLFCKLLCVHLLCRFHLFLISF